MADANQNDPVWQTAVDWVLHAHDQPLDPKATAALTAWLDQDPAYRAAYEEAARVWLLTGLVPSFEDDGSNSST